MLYGSTLCRDETYKLIWGFPGQTDGYGLDADFISNMAFYRNYVNASTRRVKRGGPYFWTIEQRAILDAFMAKVNVTEDQLAAGTGYMHLFDLSGWKNDTLP